MSSPEDHLRRWLAGGLTGCTFAARLAKAKDALVFATFSTFGTVEEIDATFEAASTRRIPAILIFSGIRSEGALATQLLELSNGSRWRVSRENPDGLETDDVFVGLEWKVREGIVSAPMGLGPFATMPVTRRAPYVCIVAWLGGHDNEHWTKTKDQPLVHLLDTDLRPHRIGKTGYKNQVKASREATNALLSELGDDASHYRRTAFRLQAAAAQHLVEAIKMR